MTLFIITKLFDTIELQIIKGRLVQSNNSKWNNFFRINRSMNTIQNKTIHFFYLLN